ncbi:serine/threonine-protein kinase [Archangium lipolyticum]|uniref:serine/threonine-protein kinase n=1 Tax=Archangium lipolyticum TaxID=2970465 RepID=UPI002DD678D1|nr:serine/threonine-protein kinase [Archangium lipolyticum]
MGTVLRDTYEITSLLGKGGMGSVFLAQHRRLSGLQVAVKVLRNSASQNPELYARFRREAEIASQLGHPNIVEVVDFDALPDGTPFLVMECLRGESLEQRLERGRLPLDKALSIVRQIGSALQAAHRAGVVHRDLKPANVFLVPTDSGGVVDERVKLLDFGISKMLDSQTLQTQEAVLMGTPQYMSPEQAMGKNREIDARTDLFALGCIVYEMLTGTPPFAIEGDGGSVVQVIFRIVHTQPEPLATLCPEVPARVLAAVERALSKNPGDRQPDVATFVLELTGSPLQSLTGIAVPSFSSSRARSIPVPEGEGGFAATHVPFDTARLPAPDAMDEGGFAATHVPSSTARFPAPAAASMEEAGVEATYVPSSTVMSQQRPAAAPVVPATAPQVTLSRPAPRAGLMAGAGVLLLGCVAAGWWFGPRFTWGPTETTVVVALPAPAMKAPAPPEPSVAPAPVKVVAPVAPVPPVAPVVERRPASRVSSPGEAVPEEVRGMLEQGELALAEGKTQEALDLAARSLRIRPSGAGFSLSTRVYCTQGSLGHANARWREGRSMMSLKERARVRQFCDKHDIQL